MVTNQKLPSCHCHHVAVVVSLRVTEGGRGRGKPAAHAGDLLLAWPRAIPQPSPAPRGGTASSPATAGAGFEPCSRPWGPGRTCVSVWLCVRGLEGWREGGEDVREAGGAWCQGNGKSSPLPAGQAGRRGGVAALIGVQKRGPPDGGAAVRSGQPRQGAGPALSSSEPPGQPVWLAARREGYGEQDARPCSPRSPGRHPSPGHASRRWGPPGWFPGHASRGHRALHVCSWTDPEAEGLPSASGTWTAGRATSSSPHTAI